VNVRNPWSLLPALTGLAAALLTGCGDGGPAGETPRVVLGMSDDVLATDPAGGYDPGSRLLFTNVFQSLLSFPQGSTVPQPEAAEQCSFDDPRAKVYRCTLKKDLLFSNGDPLTAKDVKFSFDRLLDINDASGPAAVFSTLGTVETPDERTVVFRLKTSDAAFPSKLASAAGSIVDHRQYDAHELREDGQVVGSGPYTLDFFGRKEAVLSVNKNYRGTAEVENTGVTLVFFHGDQGALRNAVTDGRVDIAYRGLSARDIADLERRGDTGVRVVEGNGNEVRHLVFNMDDPVVGRIGVRRAIAHLIDREALVRQVHRDTTIPLYSVIPAGITGHSTAFFDAYGARPSRAEAAAALRAEGITDKVGLTLWSTPSYYGPSTNYELVVIASQLNASGLFSARMRSVPFDQYEKGIAAGKYGVYVKGWVPDYPDADNFTTPFFGRDNGLKNNYSNRTISGTLLPRTAIQSDRPGADRDFGSLQDIVASQLPLLPIWQSKQYMVVRDGVHGAECCLDPYTAFRFWKLSKG
jgi:peptide/nickel transport system substrate-binding protein